MAVDLVMLARFRQEAAGMVSPDLLSWSLGVISSRLSPQERYRLRDEGIRSAAALINGTRWAQARQLHTELKALAAGSKAVDPVAVILQDALAFTPGKVPKSMRSLLRILASRH